MIKGKTSSGFEFTIDEEIKDDLELLEKTVKLEQGDMSALADVIESMLGVDGKKALYDHCRSEKGRVSAQKVFTELEEINTKIPDDTKN